MLTRPIFQVDDIKWLNHHVLVLTDFQKTIYLPTRWKAAYIAPNGPKLTSRMVPSLDSVSQERDFLGF